jgi:hypothetical protein
VGFGPPSIVHELRRNQVAKISLRVSAVVAGTLIALATSLAVASAHYVFTAGKYRVAIGWQNEPAFGTDTFVGEQNAIQVFVDIASADDPKGTPVSTLNQDCTHPDFQVTVTVGTTTSSPFCPAPAYDPDTGNGRLDEYDYALIPTVVGNYTFHIFGTIGGTPINQTVTSGPTTFDSVADSSSVEFPVVVPATSAIATKVDAVGQRAGDALASAQSAATSAGNAKSSASSATVIAIVAIVVALVLNGVTLAFLGFGMRRRRT